MAEPSVQMVRESAELASFATAVTAWCQHPTNLGRCFLTRPARRLADLMNDLAAFEQFAGWLDHRQAQAGGDTR